jgi:uncharacterized membrane protein YoaK (UPF0700 family)
MLAARAHTFVLQTRLAISLAWVAGYTNAIAFGVCGVAVSHVTGHATGLGRDAVLGQWSLVSLLAALLGAFVVGAFFSGLATELARLRGLSSIYIAPAALEIVLLLAFAVGVELHDPAELAHGAGLWTLGVVASMAMGVQNAAITRISSGVVRTTHLTGILTDLGHESAQLALFRRVVGPSTQRQPTRGGPSAGRLLLLASIFGAFVLGAAAAAVAFQWMPRLSMLPPVALLAWIIVQDARRPICEVEEALLADVCALPGGDAEQACRIGVGVYRAIPRGGARTGEARLPELGAWLSALPASRQTVVLDLGEARAFGPQATAAIEALLDRAHREGRRVVLAGIHADTRASIHAVARPGLLDDTNCAPSVDEAVMIAMREPDGRSSAKPTQRTR